MTVMKCHQRTMSSWGSAADNRRWWLPLQQKPTIPNNNKQKKHENAVAESPYATTRRRESLAHRLPPLFHAA